MTDPIAVLLGRAEAHLKLLDHRAAIDDLRRVIAIAPDHARAHAMLAIALVGAKRLAGAASEANKALAVADDPDAPYCHHAAAVVCQARRQLDRARDHCELALAGAPSVETYVVAAGLHRMRGGHRDARQLLDQALALDPDHVGALAARARLALDDGDLDRAGRLIVRARHAHPHAVEPRAVAGWIALEAGDVASAEAHARFVLGRAADDPEAMRLYTAIKGRGSCLLGAWWRWNARVSALSEANQLGVLLATFVAMQLAVILAGALGYPGLERTLQYVWLGLCGYLWIAPQIFQRWLTWRLGNMASDPGV